MNNTQVESLVVSIADAAAMLDVSHTVIRRMIKQGKIPENKVAWIGGQRKINKRFVTTLAGEDVEAVAK